MDRHLPVLPMTHAAPPCVWVDAGVLSYRLCDRGFSCESCPLDAALRNDPRLVFTGACAGLGEHPDMVFPRDRLYAPGHRWVQVICPGRIRTGLDACAARLLPPACEVRFSQSCVLARGDPLGTLGLEGGELLVRSPVAGRVRRWNRDLELRPAMLTVEPYTSSWIAEMQLDGREGLDDLLRADAAREQARADIRSVGRRVALSLLSYDAPETAWVDSGLLETSRRAMGSASYLSMIRGALL